MTPAPGEIRTYTNRNGERAYVVLGTDTVFSKRRGRVVDLIVRRQIVLVLRNDDGTPKWTPATNGTDGCGVTHAPVPRSTEF
jgi:hypothetical protein